MVECDKLYESAEVILEEALYGVKKEMPLLTVCANVNRRLYKLLGFNIHQYKDGEKITSAIRLLDYLGEHVTAEVREAVKSDGSVDELTIIIAKSDVFQDEADRIEDEKFDYDPTQGPREWTSFEMQVSDNRTLDLVKKARRYGLQGRYTPEEIPEVYSSVNHLQSIGYGINKWVIDVAQMGHSFVPDIIDDEDKKKAVRAIAQMKKQAKKTNSVQRLEESDWFADTAQVVSSWSKRFEFDECVRKGTKWAEGELHFVYTLDSRSRVYSSTSFLHPQGSDFAKSMLVFSEKRRLDPQTLAVVTFHRTNLFSVLPDVIPLTTAS